MCLINTENISFYQTVHLRATAVRTVPLSVLRTVRMVTVTAWMEPALGVHMDT